MNFLDYGIIAFYLVGLLLLGALFREQKSKQDYFLGGRSLGWKPLTLSIMATQLSAISFISAPAFVGLREGGGLIWLSYELALPLAMLFLLVFILPTLHRSGVISVYDYLEKRFNQHTRLLISLVFQISRSFATGIMIYAISIILQSSMGLALWQSVVLIGVVTMIYSTLGGMKAVVYGDAIQMLLIVTGSLVCLYFALHELGGWMSFTAMVDVERLQAVQPSSLGFEGDGFGLWPMLFGGAILYASYYGCDQSEAQRSLSAQSTSDLRKMLLAAGVLRFPVTLIYCFTGLAIGTLAMHSDEFYAKIPPDSPDWMMPIFIINYLPNGIIGILIVAIMAAAMSSLSSAINSLSAVSTQDYFRLRKQDPDEKQYLQTARITGFFWGIVTLILSFYAGQIADTVIEAINKIGSLFYGPVLATFSLAILSKRVTAKAMNLGLLAGVLSNLYLAIMQTQIFWFWWNLTGFLVTCVIAYLLSGRAADSGDAADKESTAVQSENGVTSLILVGWFLVILTFCFMIPTLFGI